MGAIFKNRTSTLLGNDPNFVGDSQKAFLTSIKGDKPRNVWRLKTGMKADNGGEIVIDIPEMPSKDAKTGQRRDGKGEYTCIQVRAWAKKPEDK